MAKEAVGVALDEVVAEVVLLFHQLVAGFFERVHLDGVVVVDGLVHQGVEVADLQLKLVHLIVVGVQFLLCFRGHDFHVARVIEVAHNGDVLVVGEERHGAAFALHFQCIKDLRVVGRGSEDSRFVGDGG